MTVVRHWPTGKVRRVVAVFYRQGERFYQLATVIKMAQGTFYELPAAEFVKVMK